MDLPNFWKIINSRIGWKISCSSSYYFPDNSINCNQKREMSLSSFRIQVLMHGKVNLKISYMDFLRTTFQFWFSFMNVAGRLGGFVLFCFSDICLCKSIGLNIKITLNYISWPKSLATFLYSLLLPPMLLLSFFKKGSLPFIWFRRMSLGRSAFWSLASWNPSGAEFG